MAGNNSCGARSLAYGTMRDNVVAIDGVLADGRAHRFGEVDAVPADSRGQALTEALLDLGRREAGEIAASRYASYVEMLDELEPPPEDETPVPPPDAEA